jgi:hypothetical protein
MVHFNLGWLRVLFCACAFLSSLTVNATVTIIIHNNTASSIYGGIKGGTVAEYPTGGSGIWGNWTIAAGATYTFLRTDSEWYNGSSSYPWRTERWFSGAPYSQYVNRSATGTVDLWVGGAPVASCVRIVPYTNTGIRVKRAKWILDGVTVHQADVSPGATESRTIIPPDCADYSLSLIEVNLTLNSDMEFIESDDLLQQWADLAADATTPVNGQGIAPQPQISGPNVYDGGAAGPVDWTGQTNTQGAVQQGFSSMIVQQNEADKLTVGLLNGIKTNTDALHQPAMTLGEMQAGAGAADDIRDQIAGYADALAIGTSVTVAAPDLTVSIGQHTIDLDPLHHAGIAALLATVKAFVFWLLCIVMVLAMLKVAETNIRPLLAARQATAASATPGVSSGSAFGMAVASVVLIGACVVGWFVAITATAWFAGALANPFSSGGTMMSRGSYFLTAFLPISEGLGMIMAYWAFKVSVIACTAGAVLAIRFLVGCFVVLAVVPDSLASSISFQNLTGAPVESSVGVFPVGQTVFVTDADFYLTRAGYSPVTVPVSDSLLIWQDVRVKADYAVVSSETDTLEGFWLGVGVAAVMWASGLMWSTVRKVQQA